MKLISRTLAGVAISVFAAATANAATSNIAAPSIDTVPAVELTTETVTLVAGDKKIDCSKAAVRITCLQRRANRRNSQANQKTKKVNTNIKERLKKQGYPTHLKSTRELSYLKRQERKNRTREHYNKQAGTGSGPEY